MLYGKQLLHEIQPSASIDIICRTIRMGKEIDDLQPSDILKAFDPITGTVMYMNITIEKSTWSIAIPTTRKKFHDAMAPLFECTNILEKVLDTNNKLVLAGNDTTVFVTSESGHQEQINVVKELLPILDDPTNTDKIQQSINMLFQLEQGTLMYLSSGAGRGDEVNGIHPFNTFQEYFNSLRFQMIVKKGSRAGKRRSRTVNHYVCPTLARYIAVLHLCIYPAALEVSALTVPGQADAREAADRMFMSVFGLVNTGTGTRDNREFLVQVMNYLASKSLAKTSTTKEHARQFGHTEATHDKCYAGETFHKDRNGNIIISELQTARDYWAGLGEKNISHARVVDRDENTIDAGLYHKALQRGLRDSTVTLNEYQSQACQIIDDNSNGNKHVFVNLPPGTGKSAMWDAPLLARKLHGSRNRTTLVISPWESLLAQHKRKSHKFAHGT